MEQPSHVIEAVFEPTTNTDKILVLVRVRDSRATFKMSPHDLNKKAWLEKFSKEDVAHIGFLNAATYTDELVPLKYFPTRKRPLTHAVLALSFLFVGFLMLSNVTGGRVVECNLDWPGLLGKFSIDFPAALVVFPMTYAFSTIITEVYGYRVSRIVIWGGMTVNFMFVIGMWFLSLIPNSPVWEAQNSALAQSYGVLAGEFARTFLASTVAYFFGEFVNAMSLAKFKLASAGQHLWVRVVFSTSIANVIDSTLFCAILFWGRLPTSMIIVIIGTQIVVKTLYELILLPLVTTVSRRLKEIDGVDYYDYHTNFNPFSLRG
ncbi:VUT family protein [Trinickia violacea]|uniref:Probable queuosine precursor transporter n=1 Tax=Trinickia violacea TaxID=2571746 RepID=A0A4P8IW65_9BURK|nr:queuosine precursor transporter [Trinickia violacea]QCP52731.1 VUT family protein [Trinickia violacea]